ARTDHRASDVRHSHRDSHRGLPQLPRTRYPRTTRLLGLDRLGGVCCAPLGAVHDALAGDRAFTHAARVQLTRRRFARRLRPATAAVTSPILEVRNLSTHFFTDDGEVKAFRDVSFSLAPGETLGIVGESGCGKSVTAMSVLGLVQRPGKVVNGEILFKGRDLLKLSK